MVSLTGLTRTRVNIFTILVRSARTKRIMRSTKSKRLAIPKRFKYETNAVDEIDGVFEVGMSMRTTDPAVSTRTARSAMAKRAMR